MESHLIRHSIQQDRGRGTENLHQWKVDTERANETLDMEFRRSGDHFTALESHLQFLQKEFNRFQQQDECLGQEVDHRSCSHTDVANQNSTLEPEMALAISFLEVQGQFEIDARKLRSPMDVGWSVVQSTSSKLEVSKERQERECQLLQNDFKKGCERAGRIELRLKEGILNGANQLSEMLAMVDSINLELDRMRLKISALNKFIGKEDDVLDCQERDYDTLKSLHVEKERLHCTRIQELNQVVSESQQKTVNLVPLCSLVETTRNKCIKGIRSCTVSKDKLSRVANNVELQNKACDDEEQFILHTLKTQAEQIATLIEERANIFQSLESKEDALLTELRQLKSGTNNIRTEYSSFVNQNLVLQEEISDLTMIEKEYKNLRDDFEGCVNVKDRNQHEIQKLQQINLQRLETEESNRNFKSDLRKLESEVADLDLRYKSIKTKLESTKPIVAKLDVEETALRSKLQDCLKTNIAQDIERVKCKDQLQSLQKTLDMKVNESVTFQVEADDMANDVEKKYQGMVDTLEIDMSKLRKSFEDKTNKIVSLKQILEEAKEVNVSKVELNQSSKQELEKPKKVNDTILPQKNPFYDCEWLSDESEEISSKEVEASKQALSREKRVLDSGTAFDFLVHKAKQVKWSDSQAPKKQRFRFF